MFWTEDLKRFTIRKVLNPISIFLENNIMKWGSILNELMKVA
jgi:hypothetical protein